VSKPRKATVSVKGTDITVLVHGEEDFISLTDIARHRNPDHTDDLVRNWLRNRNTIEFLGIWESLNNPGFKPVEFDGFRRQAGLNSFALTPKQWIEATSAVGIVSKRGRYGGTFAHKDIAFEFASWISVEFKLYLIKEFQRLEEDENSRLSLAWNLNRTLSKLNYRLHTDAIQTHLIPPEVTPARAAMRRGVPPVARRTRNQRKGAKTRGRKEERNDLLRPCVYRGAFRHLTFCACTRGTHQRGGPSACTRSRTRRHSSSERSPVVPSSSIGSHLCRGRRRG
jgi:hypothetical protein